MYLYCYACSPIPFLKVWYATTNSILKHIKWNIKGYAYFIIVELHYYVQPPLSCYRQGDIALTGIIFCKQFHLVNQMLSQIMLSCYLLKAHLVFWLRFNINKSAPLLIHRKVISYNSLCFQSRYSLLCWDAK